ncbi:hypothetical protein HHK36_005555 [Tetracentron sinense]|uniref:Gnk2-homologous domain-containing protein n=1 Tax=Tetracentron sinense TaxID=13715 RepID=A0A834ZL80_TETSI|nr:hypothetical protein HHK36_005555 [Tetracentron sinense]
MPPPLSPATVLRFSPGNREYCWCTERALDWDPNDGPNLIVDDSCNATLLIHEEVKTKEAKTLAGWSFYIRLDVKRLKKMEDRKVEERASVLLLIMVYLLTLGSDAQPTYLYHDCPNTTTYTPNSTYQSNLRILLSSLSSNATVGDGFYNLTSGRNPNIAYGFFLCRGDVTDSVCRDCVETVGKDILERCPKEKVAIAWYDECMIRYSNKSIFSILQEVPAIYMLNTQNISEPTRFNQLLADTMDGLAIRAISDQNRRKFVTDEANFTRFQTLYSLVQCTPDLSASQCNRCLRGAIAALPSCCSGKQGGRVLLPSCNLRYEVYPFYQIEAPALAPSPIPLPPPSPTNRSTPGTYLLLKLIQGFYFYK